MHWRGKSGRAPWADRVFVAPGNAGTEIDAENVPIGDTDIEGLIAFAKQNEVDLTIVGPEGPLALGLVDAFEDEKLPVFGPRRAAAQLEASKVFCKELLHQANVPTADYRVFRDGASAARYVRDRYPTEQDEARLVIKADGLAQGKGVFVCHTRTEAFEAIDRIVQQREFGDAGSQLVIEERLSGEEASIIAITDGKTILPLPGAQDHKAAWDGDKGPNTGGMGAYSPAPVVTDEMMRDVESSVLVPTVHAMKRNRSAFQGILYAGLMITNQGPKVLEFNVRFGDPECQPLLMRMEGDLLEILLATVERRLDEIDPPTWDARASVCVVMASEGYPASYEKGGSDSWSGRCRSTSRCQGLSCRDDDT